MSATVSDVLVDRLRAWGVRRVFGYPGDGIHGVMAALVRVGHAIEFVQARHEQSAASMACAHAKWTGRRSISASRGRRKAATGGREAVTGRGGRGGGGEPPPDPWGLASRSTQPRRPDVEGDRVWGPRPCPVCGDDSDADPGKPCTDCAAKGGGR